MKIFNDLHINMAAGSAGSYIFRKILIWIPVIVMYIVIFGFSGQNGEQSGGLSRKVANIVIDMAQDIHIISIEDDELYGSKDEDGAPGIRIINVEMIK